MSPAVAGNVDCGCTEKGTSQPIPLKRH